MKNPAKNNQHVFAYPDLAVSITAESDALAAATVANWMSAQGWRTPLGAGLPRATAGTEQEFRGLPQFEIDIECDASETITAAKLYGCRLGPVTIADDTFTASGSTLTASSHALLDGDGPVRLTSSTTLPAGLSLLTDYFVEHLSSNTFALHSTRAGAIAGDTSTLITTTDAGTGTHTLADKQGNASLDDNSRRFHFALIGDLNEAASVVLTAQTSYVERINHSPLNLYYVLVATVGVAQTVTVRVTPIQTAEC